jgi:hypothetical protein
MGVVSPERTEAEPPRTPDPPEPPRERSRRRVPWRLLAAGLVLVALVTSVNWARGLLPDFDNPFSEKTVDRSGPAVLKSIQDIGEYRAVAGNYQVIVDLEKDTKLPAEILGERTLFVATGSVDGGVDLSKLDADSVRVTDDRRTAAITLPHATLFDAEVDLDESYVYDRERGLFNRIGSLFSDDDAYEREVLLAAEAKLNEAARSNGELTRRAEENTEKMLGSLLRSLGFTRIDIGFA